MSDKTSINKLKQKNALMPNLVHSLDSTALFMLYNMFKYCNKYINFYSVHDCYGVTAKYVEDLITILKTIYIELYSNSIYIQKFDNDLINLIITTYGDKNTKYDSEQRIIHTEFKTIHLPQISTLINCKNKPL